MARRPTPAQNATIGPILALAVCLAGAGETGGAHAQATGPGTPAPDAAHQPGWMRPAESRPLWESPADRRRRAGRQREDALATSLGWLQGVTAARVHLGFVDHDLQRAAVVVRSDRAIDRVAEEVRAVVTGAAPELSPGDVAVVVVPSGPGTVTPAAADLTAVGPFSVATSDAQRLRGALAALLVLNATLAGALIWLRRQRRRALTQ